MDASSLSPDNLQSRLAAAEEIHKRAHERDREHQRLLDALSAAELNLKAARNSESQALARAAAAEAALARRGVAPLVDPETVAALEKQLGEARRQESAATAEAAALRTQIEELRRSHNAANGVSAQATLREDAARARAELAALQTKLAQLARELETVKARNAQLESAALTIQSRSSGPPPELLEARAELEKARQAARSAEGSAAKFRRDCADAQTRIKGLETTLAATRAAISTSSSVSGDLAAARREAADLRKQLQDARSEIGRLRNTQKSRDPRPLRDQREPRDRAPNAAPPANPTAHASTRGPSTDLSAPSSDAPADAPVESPPASQPAEVTPPA